MNEGRQLDKDRKYVIGEEERDRGIVINEKKDKEFVVK